MEITGRVTGDAVVRTVQSTVSEVVNFSIAINDRYKAKGSDEFKEVTTFINCGYWLSSKVAEGLKKGAIVQLTGRIGMNVYNNMDGDAVGSLTFHVNSIKVLAFAKRQEETPAATPVATAKNRRNAAVAAQPQGTSDNDDLPF